MQELQKVEINVRDCCKIGVPKRRVWKLQQADLRDKFCETFMGEMNDTKGKQLDNIWSRLKQSLLCVTEKTCG